MAEDVSDNVISLPDAKSAIADLAALDSVAYGLRRKAEAARLGIGVGILDKEVQKRRRAPADPSTSNLILSDRGAIVPILANAIEILRQGAADWPLKFEEFSQRAFLNGSALEDADLTRIAEWIQRKGCHAGKNVTDLAVFHMSNENRFHVVKDWLEPLVWDSKPRLDALLIDHAHAADTPLTRAFTSKWFIQGVARIYRPGCQADATLVLESPQGAGKSSLLRTIFGDEWFTDHLPNLDHKDAQIQLLGIWCIEIAELAALNGKESAKTKQFLTSRDDRFRLPWDKIAKNHPRASVFAGTVNPGASGYLKDETGGRRYWPIAVNNINVPAVAEIRDQLWAEALHRFRTGENWHIGNGEIADQAKAAQADRFVTDAWQPVVSTFVQGREFVKLEEIFTNCVYLSSVSDWDQNAQNRISKCLSHLGWVRKQRRVPKDKATKADDREWGYAPASPVTDEPPPATEFDFQGCHDADDEF